MAMVGHSPMRAGGHLIHIFVSMEDIRRCCAGDAAVMDITQQFPELTLGPAGEPLTIAMTVHSTEAQALEDMKRAGLFTQDTRYTERRQPGQKPPPGGWPADHLAGD